MVWCSFFIYLFLLPFFFTLVSLQETYEAKRNEFMGELQKKEEEMRQMFVQRVKEKEAELKEAEKEVWLLHVEPTLTWNLICKAISFCSCSLTQNFFCHVHVAAWEIWPPEETAPGREKETGGKEEVPGWRAQHVQTEKDCCRAPAESSSAGRGLYHTQEGQREKKVSIVVFPLHLYRCSTGAGDHQARIL